MKKYIWQNENWQNFDYDKERLLSLLSKARVLQGNLLGKMSTMDIKLQEEAQKEVLIEETLNTSEIEGTMLSVDSVRSSVAQRLGFPEAVGISKDKSIEGTIDILMDAVRNHELPLSIDRMNGWQAALFPTGYSGIHKIVAGDLRHGGMQVQSGALGREKIHFEAPNIEQMKKDFEEFIGWFNNSFEKEDGLLRAASAHLKFVTIHPYEDGNGRLTRALTDMALAQDEKNDIRFYSMSAQIMKERESYYEILEAVQSLKKDLTSWFEWFLGMFIKAIENSANIIETVFIKAAFWNKIKEIYLNDRQRKVVIKLLEAVNVNQKEGVHDTFEGGLTTRKYASMAHVSRATAYREIEDMFQKGVIEYGGGKGRSVKYYLKH